MGDYNSYAPQILGQEWVPIRDEDLLLSPVVNTIEVGQGFTLATARTLSDGRFYVSALPSSDTFGQVFQISVYPSGLEDASGPIRSVIIPVNNGGVTGNASFSPGVSVADSLADPSDSKNVTLSGGIPTDSNADLYFATNSYSALLSGKRIVALNLLYSATSSDILAFSGRVGIFQPTQTDGMVYASTSLGIEAPEAGPGRPQISRISLGEVSPFFSNTPLTTTERMPWIYTDLQRFEISAGTGRICVRLSGTGNPSGTALFYLYAALEVIYCEEQRVAVGGVACGAPGTSGAHGNVQQFALGTNRMPMRTMSALALNPALAVGDYMLMLSSPETGILAVELTPSPLLNSVRQLYEIPAHPGVEVAIPKPAEDHLGETFTSTSRMILPQISLHASGGTLTEPHAYGRQVSAQVYGSITASQSIDDTTIITSATNFPQVRYYARRFGDTTIPLKLFRTSTPAQFASITPEAFDELTEIVDGWKEVTLRFSTTPTFTGSGPSWTWSATNEDPGNRWEVLGACAPAISGVPGNLFALAPAPNTLTNATYLAPAGATVNLSWVPQGVGSAYVSATAADATSDATLIFSQDPPTITGVSLTQATQAVTGIGFDCGSLPCCIPSGIGYNQLAWSAPLAVIDTFSRVVAAGWGSADTGQAWSVVDGAAADFSVNGSTGLQTHPILATNHSASINVGTSDQDVTIFFKLPALLTGTGAQAIVDLRARYTDANNHYRIRATIDSDATILFTVTSRAAGTSIQIGTTPTLTHVAADWYGMRLSMIGSDIRAKSWNATTDAEPDWQLEVQDAAVPAANGVNVFSFLNASVTNTLPFAIAFDNFTSVQANGGGYELQRLDTTDFDWQTVMLASDPRVQSFKDYEARVGINSVYRIRNLNVYNFAGAWSTQVTGAPPAPGVTGGCGGDATGALIFTSNADQTGGSNAAYVMQWESDPSEDFTLPEGDAVTFQPMYGRDGAVAFHGTERGLETFSRTLLIQAAAIDPVRLADTKTLRDLAWADLPYVCVRDDIGDRWLANVRVPAVTARLNRTKYMSRVDIVEVTTTPAAVDP